MILEFFSSPVGIAAILSFFIGSFGYVIARMWVQPLLRYRLLKSRVRALMAAMENLPGDTDTQALPGQEIRKTAAKLTDCYNKTLPQWYQLMLSNRNESPDTAVADLMALANVKDRQHATKRIANIRLALKITPKNEKG
ncbi:hypothetical protein [Desulfosarcina sp.]|uniref:hypothetical protein n=1 Tax=Desulfosarcina sp. TaxID=2027861 RepID=UPI0029A55B40|nr:hypothetical protein [Desulfosarcina sp.]MDX2453382.1 hypothetical protein [Desulfosarcina sp.]